jgi:mannonate dehydratase
MNPELSRRRMMQAVGASAMAPSLMSAAAARQWPLIEGPGTPKISLGGVPPTEAGMRRVKQIGVDYLLSNGGPIPWTEESLRKEMDAYKAGGLTLYNLMISGLGDATYARPSRDKQIESVQQSIRAAGKAGLRVVEYNWYAHRAMEGYFEETGRTGAGHTGFDYEKMKGLPPIEREGAHTAEEMWKNITYFLRAVVPVAEESGVLLALHPNDPPAPLSRGSEQIMGTVAGWKRLIEIVNSPSNGITFDCGVTREMGEDPVAACRYFASRKRINHMHFRNVIVRKPYERYTEVFIDEGQVDMFGVMKELVRQKYSHLIYPEHPRAIDYDRERGRIGGYPGGGGFGGEIYNVAYTRAMLQAALES